MSVISILKFEEGYRARPYHCSEGYPTVGIGKRIGPKGADLSLYGFTVPESVADAWLRHEIIDIAGDIENCFDWVFNLNAARQAVVISMCYQLGFNGFCKFRNTIKHIKEGNFDAAADEMLDSRWARQTPARAKRHAKLMKYGDITLIPEYC